VTDLDKLIEEFRTEFEAGSQPDPGKFLARAEASERTELANQLDAYLDTAPLKEWDPGAYARSPTKVAVDRFFESLEGEAGTWPELLPSLRNKARIKREDLVARLAAALGFPGETQRVAAYYHQMEHGQLDATRVSDTVLERLGELVGTTRERLRAAGAAMEGPAGGGPHTHFARKAFLDPEFGETDELVSHSLADAAMPAAAPQEPERDELDQLFLGE
jgi:hypothetical protein